MDLILYKRMVGKMCFVAFVQFVLKSYSLGLAGIFLNNTPSYPDNTPPNHAPFCLFPSILSFLSFFADSSKHFPLRQSL